MTDDLVEIKGRLAHVGAEVDRIQALVADYLSEAIMYATYPCSLPGTYRVFGCLQKTMPISIRSLVGTAANETKAALDELVCRLAVRNGKSMNGNYFPASRTRNDFEDKGMKQIRKLSPSDKQIFIDLAPYDGGAGTLHLLHLADLQRKHRPLNVHTAGAGMMALGGFAVGPGGKIVNCMSNEVTIECAEFRLDQNLGQDAPGPIHLLATGIPIQLGVDFAPRLAFETPDEIRGLDVVDSLRCWLKEANGVVSNFDA